MKKKILGLALALMMIISLLPLTTIAAAPADTKVILWNGGSDSRIDVYGFQNTPAYVVVKEEGGVQLAVTATEVPTDNYVKLTYTNGVVGMEFKNFVFNRPTGMGGGVLNVSTDGEYDIVVTLEGANSITANTSALIFSNTGKVTIGGTGSLTVAGTNASNDSIYKKGAGDMEIKDVTINITKPEGSGQNNGITVNGNVTIDNANLDVSVDNGAGIRTGSARSSGLFGGNVTIKNGSNVKFAQKSGQRPLIDNIPSSGAAGTTTIENSSVELIGNANNTKVLKAAPTITGTYSSQKYSIREQGSSFVERDYTAAAFNSNIRWLKLVHECVALADDGDCTTAVKCACGEEVTPAKTHIAGEGKDDCTKDTICGNAGCTQVFEAKKGDAHVAGQDDGDCTTDIKCANCDQVATKGAEKHVWDRTDCSVAGSCTTAGCTQSIAAGTHTGGTATCKDKAKCTECGEEYGDLGACAPAADDGDCTTAIKCTVCGKDTTAGEAAHKYTDKNDTSCDNAGCTNTRKVEGTENPKTGDNSAIAVVAALMVTAAAAFVTTKKFAR